MQQAQRKTKKKKKTRYVKLTLKLTKRQKKSLVNYCMARRTTPNKLIKKSIRRFLNGFERNVPEEYYVTDNQLDLFEPESTLKQ